MPMSLDRLVHPGIIRLPRMVELLSTNPASILRVPGGRLREGDVADITILAPDMGVTVLTGAPVRSKSNNTPYHGWTLRGSVAATIVGGQRAVYVNPDVSRPRTSGRTCSDGTRRDDIRRRALEDLSGSRC